MSAQFALVDFKACLMHALGAGHDENCRYDSITGREVNTAEFAFRTFLDMYVVHWLEEQNYAPWQIIIAHEGGHAYRTQISPDYKANRKPKEGEAPKKGPETTEEYERLETYAKAFLANIGCTQLRVAGVEGDDVLAHLQEKLSPNFPCAIYTVDADLLRLIDENTTVWIKKKIVFNTYETFAECENNIPKNMHDYLKGLCDNEENFYPEIANNVFKFVTLFKSIIGDSSDGYNGVKGLGPAKWFDMVKNYGIDGLEQLEDIIENRDWTSLQEAADADVTDKLLNKLFNARQEWRQGWMLAKLHPQLCWKPQKNKLTKIDWYKRVPNEKRVKAILKKCQCEDIYEEYLAELMPQKWLIDANNYEGDDVADFKDLCKESFVVGWDYEGWSPSLPKDEINTVSAHPTGVSFCLGNNFQYAFYITTDHKDSANLPQETINEFLTAIPEKTATVAHNLQYETIMTATNFGTVIEGGFDTMVMNSYVDENKESGLKKCSKRELNYDQETYQQVLEKAGTVVDDVVIPAADMREVTADQVMSYGIDDSIVACHLFVLYWLRMQLEGSWDFYAENEPYFTKRTSLSQIVGCNLDHKKLQQLHEEDSETIKVNTVKLRKLLTKNCTDKVDHKAVNAFIAQDVDYLKAKTKLALSTLEVDKLITKIDSGATYLEKLMEIDDDAQAILTVLRGQVPDKKMLPEAEVDRKLVIPALVKLEVYKFREKAVIGSVYVPYVCENIAPKAAPTLNNLSKVCEAIGLTPMNSVAKAKLTEWEQEICNVDFEGDSDDTDKLTEDQQKFITLLQAAKRFFKPADRDGSKDFQVFQSYCCEKLGIKAKESWSGSELSTGSPIQMQHLFYCMLGLPVRLRSKTQMGSNRQMLGFEGACGTDSLVVDTALAEDIDGKPDEAWKGEALQCVKAIKESETRISLYHTPYPQFVNPETGRMHPSIRPCGTVTRRPTGSKPNVLQVSKHQKEGVMRSVYLPVREDHVIVAIDFAGQELRILASNTQDLNLLSAYLGEKLAKQYLVSVAEGTPWHITTEDVYGLKDVKDIHSNTGSGIIQLFGLDERGELIAGGHPAVKAGAMNYVEFTTALDDEDHLYNDLVNKVRKKPAKASNFLIAFGGTEVALSQELIIKQSQGSEIYQAIMKLYPGIEKGQAATLKFAKEHGYSQTAYGNRRHANDDLFSKQNGLVNRQMRQLFNSTIQGTAADILKIVIREAETTEGGSIWERLDAEMIAPVYDELVASVHKDNVYAYIKEMTGIMNLTPPGQAVPMMAEVSIGHDWQASGKNELGAFPTREEVEIAVAASHAKVVARFAEIDGEG